MRQWSTTGLLATVLLLGGIAGLQAQSAARGLSSRHAPPPKPSTTAIQRWTTGGAPVEQQHDSVDTHSHTKTGLLVGGAIGVAATTVFLIGFCDDPDTECGIDEVGRALLIIAVPTAALGALIGSLIH